MAKMQTVGGLVHAGRGHQHSTEQEASTCRNHLGSSIYKARTMPIMAYRTVVFLPLLIIAMLAWLLLFSSLLLCKADLNQAGDGTFHISVFSDLHYGENESTFGIPADMNSAALMRQVLSQENPDFVVLNGDLITGENTFAFNSTGYVDEIVAPLVEGGYKWASTYGNHDSKYNLSREALFAEEAKYANAYTQKGPAGTDGITNYVLPIFAPNTTGSSQTPVALLWFFDSRGGSAYQSLPANVDNIDNYVSNGTVDWYRSTQASMQVRLRSSLRLSLQLDFSAACGNQPATISSRLLTLH